MAYFKLSATYAENNGIILAKGLWENKKLKFYTQPKYKKYQMGEGEGGEIWENSIETCIISCMKRVASPGSMQGIGCLGLVHWDDPEGGEGRKEGGGFRRGNAGIPVVDSF